MKKILLLCLFFFMIACGKQEKKEGVLVIPLPSREDNIAPFEESGFDYSFEIIPLKQDTSDMNTLIKSSYRIVHYKGRFYFPGYGESTKIFDDKGNFINHINEGKGHGEIMNMNDLYIDKESDIMEVSMYDKISKYTLDGEYLSTDMVQLCKGDIYKSKGYYYMYSDFSSIFKKDSCFLNIFNYKTGDIVSGVMPKPNMIYATVDPAELIGKSGSFTDTEKPLMDKLCEYIEQNGVDTNPYVVKIKNFKNNLVAKRFDSLEPLIHNNICNNLSLCINSCRYFKTF